MSWWGQRQRPIESEHRRKLEEIVESIRVGDVSTVYDLLHQLIDLTPVDDEHVVSLLVKVMADPALHDESRKAILRSIERLFKRSDAALGGAVELLEHTDNKIRSCGSQLLSRLVRSQRHAACVYDIAARLERVSTVTRTAAIHCLQDIASEHVDMHQVCVAALCRQFNSPNSFSHLSAIDGLVLLARIGMVKTLIDEVVACLQDQNNQVRTCAVRAVVRLVKADPSSYQSWILAAGTCMSHQHQPIRQTGSEVMWEISQATGAASINHGAGSGKILAKKGKMGAQVWDVWDVGYGVSGQPCIVRDHLLRLPPAQKGLNAHSNMSRATVAHIGNRLEHPDAEVREAAVAALRALDEAGEHDRMDLIRCCAMRLGFEDDGVRTSAVDALGALVRGNVSEQVDVVMEWVEHGDSSTRLHALKALGKVAEKNDARVIKAVLAATSDPDYRVIRQALALIAHLRSND
jgi:hypothetical protein